MSAILTCQKMFNDILFKNVFDTNPIYYNKKIRAREFVVTDLIISNTFFQFITYSYEQFFQVKY